MHVKLILVFHTSKNTKMKDMVDIVVLTNARFSFKFRELYCYVTLVISLNNEKFAHKTLVSFILSGSRALN